VKVRQVTLTVEHLDEAASFYRDVLQLPVVTQDRRATVTVGSSRLVLEPGQRFRGVHHVAFGIAPADFARTRGWLQQRVELIVVDGSEVVDGPDGWSSRSVYFLGPEEILLELIARDVDAGVPRSRADGLRPVSISEVGIGVPDVAEAVRTLTRELDLAPFPPQGQLFAPVGGHHGLVVLVQEERVWFPSHHQPAARGPVVLEIDAPTAGRLSLTPQASIVAR